MRRTKKEKPGLNAQLRKSAQNWREFEDTLRVVEEAAGKNPTLTAKVLLESAGKWLSYWKKKVEKLSQEIPSAQTIGQRGTHLDTLCQFAQWNTAWVLMNYACAAAQRSGEDPNELMCEAFQQVFRAAPAMYGELMQDFGLQEDRIRQATTTVLSGWVGTQIHLGEDMKNQRLKKALDEEGADSPHKRRQLVSEKLPAATHLAWADTKPGDPLRPGSAKRNLVSRAEDYITKEGREAIDKPQWVEDFVEKEDRKKH